MIEDIAKFIEQFPKYIDDVDELLTENRIWKQRTVGISEISIKQALDWGFSGPMLRAAGLAWDLRKSQPYEIYDQLDFDIPIGQNGDCYDRYLVRMAEIRQSISLVKQCIEKMPEGQIKTEDRKISPPSRAEMKNLWKL